MLHGGGGFKDSGVNVFAEVRGNGQDEKRGGADPPEDKRAVHPDI